MPAVIFSGSEVKALKNSLNLNDNVKILSGDADPTSSAQDAPRGSIYLRTGSSGGDIFRKLDDGSSTNFELIGTGGSGGINYIDDQGSHDAEVDVSGWSAYADAAGTSPVDGTGGSPAVTITRSTSTPLRGTGSFLITKDAVNRQGEGASFDFTIDKADKYKAINIGFDYENSSAFVSGDIGIFVYDVTNTTIIRPSIVDVPGSENESKFNAVFMATDSTSYRLIFHVASTNASAYTLKYDNVQVGPNGIVAVANTTDWIRYTPTGGDQWTANATYDGYWRRVGDSMELYVEVVAGATTPTGGVTSSTRIALPSGYSIDTAKIIDSGANNSALGIWQGSIAGVGNIGGQVRKHTSNTQIELWKANPAAASYIGAYAPMTASEITNSGGQVGSAWARVFIPIEGWSSNFVFSSEGPDVAVSVIDTALTPSLTGSLQTLIYNGTVEKDTHSAYNSSTGLFTAPIDGLYDVSALYGVSGTAALNDSSQIAIVKNGSTVIARNVYTYGGAVTNTTGIHVNRTAIPLNSGDTIEIQGLSDITSPVFNSGAGQAYLSIQRQGSIISIDGNRQNKFQIKTLSADVTSDGAMSDLTFNNLIIGRTYEAMLQAYTQVNLGGANANIEIEITHNSSVIGKHLLQEASDQTDIISSSSVKFVATATSLTFVAVSAAAQSPILGNGTQAETFAQLTELNDTYQTSEF